MRFLGVSETCDLLALYLRLREEGHDVRVAVSEPLAAGTGAGLIERVADWRAELDWADIILFEAVSEGFGAVQDELRAGGHKVVGGSALGDRLENDRAFAFAALAEAGLRVAGAREFDDAAQARAFIAAHPARYVLKFSGPDFASHDNFVGTLADGRDVAAMLHAADIAPGTRFILMDHVEGVEVGVGTYFDGTRFLTPACLDWEHKRFFAGDMGELTGEMGTVATFDRSGAFFARTLQRLEPALRAGGHIGYVNLNTIVNADGIWPLELTCRFGYPGFAVLDPLQATPWGTLLARMAGLGGDDFAARPGWSVGVVLTTPPFPFSRHEVAAPVGLPILLDALDDADRAHVHLGEAGVQHGTLVTSGVYGWTAVVTGTGATVAAAQAAAYARAEKVVIPNARYRLDIGDKLAAGDLARCEALGVFG